MKKLDRVDVALFFRFVVVDDDDEDDAGDEGRLPVRFVLDIVGCTAFGLLVSIVAVVALVVVVVVVVVVVAENDDDVAGLLVVIAIVDGLVVDVLAENHEDNFFCLSENSSKLLAKMAEGSTVAGFM